MTGGLFRTQILLEKQQHEALAALAQQENRSLSDKVREIISRYLSEHDADVRLSRELDALVSLNRIREQAARAYGSYAGDPVAQGAPNGRPRTMLCKGWLVRDDENRDRRQSGACSHSSASLLTARGSPNEALEAGTHRPSCARLVGLRGRIGAAQGGFEFADRARIRTGWASITLGLERCPGSSDTCTGHGYLAVDRAAWPASGV